MQQLYKQCNFHNLICTNYLLKKYFSHLIIQLINILIFIFSVIMESFKQKISTCFDYIKNKITDNSCQLVETQRKIYYFSRFTLDADEFMKVYEITKTVKENTFKNLVDTMKYCCRGNVLLI
jgi:hypothetical protein